MRATTLDTLPPRSQSVEDFASSVNVLANRASRPGSRPANINRSLAESYSKVDPIYSRHLNERQRLLLASSARQGAQLCADVIEARPEAKLHRQTLNLMGNLLLDSVQITLGMPDRDLGRASADLVEAQAAFDDATRRTAPRSRYSQHNIGSIFGSLSARTMQIHVDGLRLGQEAQPTASHDRSILQRKRLGGVILDTIGHMHVLSDGIATVSEKVRGNAVGRFLEATAFAQHALEWHDNPGLSKDMARFALEREDRPYGYHRPRRGYDVVRMVDGVQQPIQVKASSAGEYHPDIALWKPASCVDPIEHADTIVDVFTTALSHPGSDERANAKLQISSMFQTTWTASEAPALYPAEQSR